MFYTSLTRRTCNNTFFCTYRNLTTFKTISELNTTIPIFYTYFTTKVCSIPYIWFPLGISLVNWFWYTLKGNWRYFMTLKRKCNTLLLFLLLHCRLFLSTSTTFFYRIRLFFLPILFSWGKKHRIEISLNVFIFY